MACSVQCAQDYVSDARIHLIEQLKNLPLIIEKLYQKKVLNNTEVSDLEAIPEKCRKSRKILDWITNKGKDACYEFLRILDLERKSVLPPELHIWISHFSFGEESDDRNGPTSCHEFWTLLKTKAKQILDQQWKQSNHFFGGNAKQKFTYIPLVLDTNTEKNKPHNKIIHKSKKSKKPRGKKLRSYIPKDTCRYSPEDLLNSQEKSILLVGKPGIGKTTAVKQMLYFWAERHDDNLDFMFYFDKNMLMNIPTTSNLQSLLLDSLIMSNADLRQKAEEITQYLEDYSEKVTIIFDGISDFHDNSTLLRIIHHELLPEAKILVTCRPETEDDDFFDWPTCKVYVQGFNEESIYTYLTQMPDQDPELVNSVVDNPALFSLCHVPMYAFMVSACFSYYTSEGAHKQCTATELYIRIFRHCIQRHGKKKLGQLDAHIKGCKDTILLLAESAFSATKLKTINLEFDYSDSCIAGVFLRSVSVVSPAFARTFCSFLHNTIQEFFSALWLLEKPQKLDEVLQLCQTEESKHMKYVIPFLCGLLSETNIPLLKCLFPPNQLKGTFDGFFEKVLNTFLHDEPDEEYSVDAVFLCQCLNEFQSSEACLRFLERVDYSLDLSEEHLDPHQCCAVSFVISQSRDKPVHLNLENSVVSFSGLKTILRHSQNLRDLSTTLCQVWTTSLKCEQQSYLINLLLLCGNEIYLPITIQKALLQQAGEIITQSADPIILHLCRDENPQQLSDAFCRTISTWLPSISSVHFTTKQNQRESFEEWEKRVALFKLNLCLQAALHQKENVQTTVKIVTSCGSDEECDFLLDLYSHVKQYETETGRTVLPALLPVYQSAPAEWIINLSERKASLLLEVLKLQAEKKTVELRGWSDEESEVRSFLQCLPYILQLRFAGTKYMEFVVCLFHEAAESERQTGEKTLELLTSLCINSSFPYGDTNYKQSAFLLDLYSHVKQYETETGRSVLPALVPVYQSIPAEWIINLSERKASLLLEVLKLQAVKKPVKLSGWSDEESEVRRFFQCLPYISQLRFAGTKHIEFLVNLFHQAAESERRTRLKTLELLMSVCTCSSLPHGHTDSYIQSAFLLDLYSHVKQYETETGRNVLPAILPVYQSVPAEWIVNLSERKASLLLEVLKLQASKKPVKLSGWSDEESEVRSFLQCLPYISHLRFNPRFVGKQHVKLMVNLFHQAAECERQTGVKTLELLTSVCTYSCFPYGGTDNYRQSAFLLDLYSHVKQYETETGRTVLPALVPVYQSAPAEWIINLSERRTSLFLEVLKLQTVKKPVELCGWSDDESEERSLLQCLPYISQLRFSLYRNNKKVTKCLINLIHQAAEIERQTGEKTLELLTSVCTYCSFPHGHTHSYRQSDFLLDLYSHVKHYETEKGRSVLPALLPVYQSVPAEWIINLSERKTSLLLEVLKLQTVKKPVELRGYSDKDSEVRSFLLCLPYISQLRFSLHDNHKDVTRFLVNLFHEAAESERQKGEKTVELLTSLCTYSSFAYADSYRQSIFLLDLYSHVKQYETETGRSVLPALVPVYQSAPAEWIINLSERKASLLLEVLTLQTKKPVELRGCSDKESEVRSFLQCLPYISQLRFSFYNNNEESAAFLVNLFHEAAESERKTGEKSLDLLTSLCTYNSFPYGYTNNCRQSDFLLDLYSHMKPCKTGTYETGKSVLSALLPVYQSVPAEWIINLSERKASLLLEVLKLQTVKKPVELWGWSDQESEVRSFLRCLPYISQLRFSLHDNNTKVTKFVVILFCQAAEIERQTGEKTLELLTSLCTHSCFPYMYTHSSIKSAFLLDLYSHEKHYETETGRNILPALLPVYQSVPAEWIINLSERRTSLLLEVLKLQTVKKPVELRGYSDKDSEVRSFLLCLPYISQLRFSLHDNNEDVIRFLVNLFHEAAKSERQTGAKTVELLTSLCTYSSFPCGDADSYRQSVFLLDLYSHVKQHETETGRSVLPALVPVYQSAPAEWIINLSERRTSLLPEVLKLQTVKKPVELRSFSDKDSEVRSFLLCLPYISQLRFSLNGNNKEVAKFLVNLIHQAAESERRMRLKTLELLTSVCTYSSFPRHTLSYIQSDFLLDLYSHVKQYETETGRNVLPALLPVYQSAPAIWFLDLSERKASLLLEVLKLQTEKKPVELWGWSDEESEVRSFLQCLPYISQLRYAESFIPCLSELVVKYTEETELLTALLAAMDSTFIVNGVLLSKKCRAVGRALGLSPSQLNLTLKPRAISLRGAVLLFRHITHLHKLCLNDSVVGRMAQAFRAERACVPLVIEELSVVLTRVWSTQKLSRILSSLASLLNIWTVQCLNLTECEMEAHSLIGLMCHPGSLTIRLSKETLQQFAVLVYEVKDRTLTCFFLEKLRGDLTSCSLSWEELIYFVQQGGCCVTVNVMKRSITYKHARELLPFLDKVHFKRLRSSVVLSIIREIYETGSAHCVSSLLSSIKNCINLNSRELDSFHCAALRFTLQRCTAVSLSLLWTSIPERELESILPVLNRVSHLSVDRLLLLKLLHCCSVSELQKEAATTVLSSLQNRLDFSCRACLDLTTQTENTTLHLTTEDCRVISTVILKAPKHIELILEDCEIEDAGVDVLFSALCMVRLRCSKALLLQFLALVQVGTERMFRAVALSQALDGEVDLSEAHLDLQACRSLALFLEYTDDLSELDLSHCRLTNHCLELLLPHLHKVNMLDLSHNDISDSLARRIFSIVSSSCNIQIVRLFNIRITDKKPFLKDKRFEIW
ncbi:uncharacterized protein LOC118804866 [Colossoma macropomum]|uniref:uncharacterized protein LOC118804866 n=1 Tax=Colossoma macropomum TaxID=42526 RepID=UPI0018652937|nr:uncharacterized protein LOC118804866 [Colossoma macropomum]